MKLRLKEHCDILPGVRKRKGTLVSNLPKDRVIELLLEHKAEPVDFAGLPEGYPKRELLLAHDYLTIESVEAARDEHLLAIEGIGKKTVNDIRNYNSKSTDKEE